MAELSAAQVRETAEFKALVTARRRLSAPIIVTIIAAYFGFVLLIAFAPVFLGIPLAGGPISVGIAAGFALLILTFLLTLIYLRLTNRLIVPLELKLRTRLAQS